MTRVTVTVDDTEVRRALGALAAQVADLTPAMTDIGQALVTTTDLTFRGQHDPWGNPWQPLSPVTLARRRGSSAHILRDTGRLANSLHFVADAHSVAVGTDVIYAATHQFGNPANRMFGRASAPIPARPFLPIRASGQVDLPPDLQADILDILNRHLQQALA